MSKDAYYFSHDSNAHKDPKILKLRAKYGWEGYGIYWAIIETLREQNNYKWLSNDKALLSYSFANGEPLINDVLNYCIEIELLIDDGEYIYSESLLTRMNVWEEKRKKRSEAGKKGAQKRWNDSDSMGDQKQSYGNANGNAISNAMAPHGKGKERKGNEKKVKEKKRFHDHVFLTEDEYTRLIQDYGEEIVKSKIEDLDNYIGSKGKRYKDHNKTLRMWLKKDAPKPKVQPQQKTEIDKLKEDISDVEGSIAMGREYFRDVKRNEKEYDELVEVRDRLYEQLRASEGQSKAI